MNTRQKGIIGEEIAASYLTNIGYSILDRNYRYKHLEIDLIAKFENTIIFVEVKLRKSSSYGFPEEFVSKHKSKLIKEAAEYFTYINNWEKNIRFDIISIIKGSTIQEVVHFQDAF